MENVLALCAEGLTVAEVARRTGIPRSTMRYWLAQGPAYRHRAARACPPCPHIAALPEGPYAYLLGLYLGDGCLSLARRGVYRLRITLDRKYPEIVRECRLAAGLVLPNKVGEIGRPGCVEVYSNSKHWGCLFPQHGPGPKHLRSIVLAPWQHDIAVVRYPYLLLRGLIQSDGWRGTNRIGGRYEYPCYQFSNRSADIRGLFGAACDQMGIASRQSGQWHVAVSRRRDVARMDLIVGEKR
ncbi:MAG TPA: helix-turn-helix domain-containing protein [Acidimicrobiales bacterium]|nr:helix-turn-helix domain-containing protein [Acidimicrobiales bacterium]